MKFAKLAIVATAMAVTPIAANAQAVGTTVYGSDGAEIGTVTANDGATVTVQTDRHLAPLPANVFGDVEGKWTISVTGAQLNTMMDQQVARQEAAQAEAQAAAEAEAAAKVDAALIVGAPIKSSDGKDLGVVEQFVDGNVVINVTDAGLVTLGRDFMATDAEGGLIARADYETLFNAASAS
ncbi:MAG: hypothetical protein AAF697_13630 [Pseudomonadota bacterium]